jgi:hypothetical protein
VFDLDCGRGAAYWKERANAGPIKNCESFSRTFLGDLKALRHFGESLGRSECAPSQNFSVEALARDFFHVAITAFVSNT